MNFKSHALGASGAAVIFFCIFFILESLQVAIIAAACAWIGAVFPDFDIGSIPARWFGRLGFAAACFLLSVGYITENINLLIGGAAPGLLALLSISFKHRGPFHKYWLPVLLSTVAAAGYYFDAPSREIVNPLLLSFSGGICVHLMLDYIFPWQIRKGWFI